MPLEKPCEECGETFSASRPAVRFCSASCVAAYRVREFPGKRKSPVRHLPRPCDECGQEYKPRRADSKFCSAACASKGRDKSGLLQAVITAPRPCPVCGETFRPSGAEQKTCSRVCGQVVSTKAKLSAEEVQCRIEGCKKPRINSKTQLCSRHSYRLTHYGDPLAEPKRKPRGDRAIDLDVDWEAVDGTSFWNENPEACPQGHPYTEENTSVRETRDGRFRRICKQCQRDKGLRYSRGEQPDRTATCVTCGVEWQARPFGILPKFCQPCAVERSKAKNRSSMAKKRGQLPKGPTYVCKGCGVVQATPPRAGGAPKFCDPCIKKNMGEQNRRMWFVKNLDRYSLTPDIYDALVEAQGSQCAICGTTDPGGNVRRWHIDHDHSCCGGGQSCGKCVRGLLCNSCNMALGMLADDQERIEAALQYLREPPAYGVIPRQ
jgi:hypothetical protein